MSDRSAQPLAWRRQWAERLARWALRLAVPSDREWLRAVEAELFAIDADEAALAYAMGGLRVAWRGRLRQVWSLLRGEVAQPRRHACFSVFLVGLIGIWALLQSPQTQRQAPLQGLVLGLGLLLVLGRRRIASTHPLAAIVLGVLLLATSQWGASVGGLARWWALGSVHLQPSVLLLPALLVGTAGQRGPGWALGWVSCALAQAFQRDPVGLLMLCTALGLRAMPLRPGQGLEAAVALLCLALLPSLLDGPALPRAVLGGDALWANARMLCPGGPLLMAVAVLALLLPGLARVSSAEQAAARGQFAAVWLAGVMGGLVLAEPLPLLSFGSSALLGYCLSLRALVLSGEAGR